MINYTPFKTDAEDYKRIVNRIFAEKPLYAFIALSLILIAVMAVRCFREPSFSAITALILMGVLLGLGSMGLSYTKKRKPFVLGELQKNLGLPQTVCFSDSSIVVKTDGAELVVPSEKLVGQYIIDRNYVMYLAVKPHRILVIPITQETRSQIDEVASYYVKNRVPLKKLRV